MNPSGRWNHCGEELMFGRGLVETCRRALELRTVRFNGNIYSWIAFIVREYKYSSAKNIQQMTIKQLISRYSEYVNVRFETFEICNIYPGNFYHFSWFVCRCLAVCLKQLPVCEKCLIKFLNFCFSFNILWRQYIMSVFWLAANYWLY